MCVWVLLEFFGGELVLTLKDLLYPKTLMSLLWIPTSTPALPMQSSQSPLSEEKSSPIFFPKRLTLIVRYCVHHVKYKISVTLRVNILCSCFSLTLHSSSSSDLAFLSLGPLQNSSSQINSLPRPQLFSVPLPKLLSVCRVLTIVNY